MSYYQPISKILWTSTNSGLGTTLTTSGESTNSGVLPVLDFRDVCDLLLTVTVGTPSGTSPTLVVQVDMQDACDQWITGVIATTSITASGTSVAYGGLHTAGTMTAPVILTGRGRVAWTVGGSNSPTWPGVKISLIGR